MGDALPTRIDSTPIVASMKCQANDPRHNREHRPQKTLALAAKFERLATGNAVDDLAHDVGVAVVSCPLLNQMDVDRGD